MNADTDLPRIDLLATSEEVLWDWPRRAAMAVVDELTSLCEQLAAMLPFGEPGERDAPAAAAAEDQPRTVTLHFVYGIALLELAERERPELLQRAVYCLGRALTLARRHVPERVVPIKMQLYRAEHALVERGAALPA